MDGNLSPGNLMFSVTSDQYGDNVHIARVDAGTDPQEIAGWMDWIAMNGLRHPAPATFVGGMHMLQPGSTGYFTVDLEPGCYVFFRGFNHLDVTPL